MPRGFALGSVSGIVGMPVEEEKRTVMGVEGEEKCGAVVRVEAVGVGVKTPVRRRPFAWAGRYPACGPPAAAWRVETRLLAVSLSFSLVERGMLSICPMK